MPAPTSFPLLRSIRHLRQFLLSACLALPLQAWSQTVLSDPFVELDQYKMEHVRQLVDLGVCGTLSAGNLTKAEIEAIEKADKERERQRLHSLRTEPGLAPYLVALAGQCLAGKRSSSYLPPVFQAMSLREDTEPAVIQHYIQLAKTFLDSNPTKRPMYYGVGDDLLRGVCYFLQLHASPENEDLLIRMMTLGEKLDNLWLILTAAEALSKTGTATRALPAMESALLWFQHLREKDASRAPLTLKMENLLKAFSKRTNSISPRSI